MQSLYQIQALSLCPVEEAIFFNPSALFWGFLWLFEVLDAVIDYLKDSSSKNYLLMKDCCVAIFCGCRTTVFSHSQTVVLCGSCSTVLCQPTGGKARLTEGCSFRKKGEWAANILGVVERTPSQESVHNKSSGCGWAFTNKSGSQLLKMFPQSVAAGHVGSSYCAVIIFEGLVSSDLYSNPQEIVHRNALLQANEFVYRFLAYDFDRIQCQLILISVGFD